MDTPQTPTPPAPDLLGPVTEALKGMSIRDKNKVADEVKTSITTLLNIQRDLGVRGPNYKLVRELYTLLIVKAWRPKS